MTLMPSRRLGRIALGAITSLSLSFTLISAAPSSFATPLATAAPTSKSVLVNHLCVEHKGLFSNGSDLTLSPDDVAVEYPETVLPGQTFTVKIQPGEMRTGGKDTGRMKYDIALPQGVKISNLRLDGGASGLNANPAAVVQRVDAAGKPNANGAFARIWDGAHSVNNGGQENDNWGWGTGRAGRGGQEQVLPSASHRLRRHRPDRGGRKDRDRPARGRQRCWPHQQGEQG